MRDIIEQLTSYQDQLDDLYPPLTGEDVFIGNVDVRRSGRPMKTRRGLRTIAFSAAFVSTVGIGALAFFLRGPADVDPVGDFTPTVLSTVPIPVPTTLPVLTPAITPPDVVAPTTTLAPLSVVPSQTGIEGVIKLTGDSAVGDVTSALDREGRLVVAYWSIADETMKLLRCTDLGCIEPLRIVVLGPLASTGMPEIPEELAPPTIDMALRPDGSPIVIVQDPVLGFATIYACDDADCSTVAIADFRDGSPCDSPDENLCSRTDFPQIAIGRDGLARIVYYHPVLQELKLAVCGDPLCDPESRSTLTIDDNIGIGHGMASIQIEADGGILIGHYAEQGDGTSQARVAVCGDGTCSAGPATFTFNDAVVPRMLGTGEGGFLSWYRSGPLYEGDPDPGVVVDRWGLMVAVCDQTGCSESTQVEADWELLMSWPADVRLLPGPDDLTAVAFAYWSPEQCALLLKIATLDPTDGIPGREAGVYMIGSSSFDSVVRDETLMVVFGGEEGGLHLAQVPLTGSDPLDAVSSVPDRCPGS
ncbi:MAG: hypothetical protein OEX97_01300 [Acidimicrobiia bacterium]|nr:hypothetical protein [Acidimicrobiia bacterium]